MGLCGEVVDLVGVDPLEKGHQARAVGQVPVVEEQPRIRVVRVGEQMVDPSGVERRGPAPDPMDLVTLVEEQFGQVGAVLTGDAGYQRLLHLVTSSLSNIIVSPLGRMPGLTLVSGSSASRYRRWWSHHRAIRSGLRQARWSNSTRTSTPNTPAAVTATRLRRWLGIAAHDRQANGMAG